MKPSGILAISPYSFFDFLVWFCLSLTLDLRTLVWSDDPFLGFYTFPQMIRLPVIKRAALRRVHKTLDLYPTLTYAGHTYFKFKPVPEELGEAGSVKGCAERLVCSSSRRVR